MLFKTPQFWFKKTSVLSTLLLPISKVYSWISVLERKRHTTRRLPKPVICVGNLTLGGSGKTPTVIALADILREHFHQTPHILSRGYSSRVKGVRRVSADDDPAHVGDEPVLLSQHAPTWVGQNRYASGQQAIRSGADILIMDDGLQNPALHKDLKLLVVDGEQGFGNGRVFPAGPLRVPLHQGILDVNAIILIHPTDALLTLLQPFGKPLFTGHFEGVLPIPPQPVIGFAGIGYPQKFKSYLEKQGFTIVEFISFPDHHNYTEKNMAHLCALQKNLGIPLITTEKDFIKIPSTNDVHALPITLVIKNSEKFYHFLEEHLKLDRLK